MREKAKGSEPIVERDDDGALLREPRTVVAFFAAEPREETAAMNPHHHWPSRRARVERTRPDVEIEAILGDPGGEGIDVAVRLVLHAVPSELLRISDSTPRLRWLRRPPPQLADRSRGVGDTSKHHYAGGGIDDSFEGAGVDRDALGRSAMGAEETRENCYYR